MNSSLPKIYFFCFFISLFAIISCEDDEIVYPPGGFTYPKKTSVIDSNFYFLPINEAISRRDSTILAFYKSLFNGFNEENLSTSAPQEDVFRFIYEGSMVNDYVIIKLTKDKIEIKIDKSGSFHLAPDFKNLSSVEKNHFNLLFGSYPLTEEDYHDKKFIDSIVVMHPELLSPDYYQKLMNKVFVVDQGPFEYSEKQIKISYDKYKYFVGLINDSEFWQRPFHLKGHEEAFADGYAFLLEAATKNKYHCIMSNMYFDGPSKFRGVFDEIVKYAGIAKEFQWETYQEKMERSKEKVPVVRELELIDLRKERKRKNKNAK